MEIPSRVRRLAVYEPGRPIEEVAREFGLGPDIVKLASNENALGPSPRAVRAYRKAARSLHRYPDGGAWHLRHALAARHGVSPDHIAVGHGSNELIALLGQVFLMPGTSIVASERAFVVYRLVADLFGAATVETPMRGFTHDVEAMARAADRTTRLIFVANPNNPTGTMVDEAAIGRMMAMVPPHVAVVFDEAYMDLLPADRQPDTVGYVREGRPVFVLRTFSKTYGLAGLRIGYAVGPPEGIDAIHRVRQPFNVNAPALAAALEKNRLAFELQPGEGAFYGPKIEFTLKDTLGRLWQCGTIQLDFNLPARLGAEYVAEDNSRKTPVMLHRAILGSMERFIGILIEHHAGNFPLWLAPVQVMVMNISENQAGYAHAVVRTLRAAGIRAGADLSNNKITYKIREHSLQKLPYLAVVGDKERETHRVSVRARGNQDLGQLGLDDFIARLKSEIQTRQ